MRRPLSRLKPAHAGFLLCLTLVLGPACAVEVPRVTTSVSDPGTAAVGHAPAAVSAVSGLKAEPQAADRQRQEIRELQDQLGSAQRASTWIPLLLVGLLATAGLAIWLGLKARSLQRELQSAQRGPAAGGPAPLRETSGAAWNATSGGEQVQAGPPAAGSIGLRAVGGARLSDERVSGFGGMSPLSGVARGLVPGVRPPTGLTPAVRDGEPTSPAVASVERAGAPREAVERGDGSLITGVPPREVSVEELMDLEQQVDFFMVLGQQQAAVDLLVGHIRNTGGTSPVAYLKLLEIYSALGQAEGYERTRSRFTKRFAAQVPDWGQPLDDGRTLDGYPGVLDRLQLLWPRPVEALRELDRMIRLSAGTALYELPAFRELVLLQGVMTDLIGHPLVERVQDIDILLPLGEPERMVPAAASAVPTGGVWAALRGTDAERPARTAARHDPHEATRPHVATPLPESGFGPAARLDLDLSDFSPAPRDFSESSSFTQPAAFTTHPHLFRDSRAAGLSGLMGLDGEGAAAAAADGLTRRATEAGPVHGPLSVADDDATLDLSLGGDLSDSASRPAPFDIDPIAPGRTVSQAPVEAFGVLAAPALPTIELPDDGSSGDPTARVSASPQVVAAADVEEPLELPDDLVLQAVGGPTLPDAGRPDRPASH